MAEPTHYERMTSAPVSPETVVSQRHYHAEMRPLVHGLKNVRDQHAEKFTAAQLAVLAAARKILEGAEVPLALVEVSKPDAPIFF